ncbi:hypothetical protein ACLKA6_018684 [Drosophila palustris]
MSLSAFLATDVDHVFFDEKALRNDVLLQLVNFCTLFRLCSPPSYGQFTTKIALDLHCFGTLGFRFPIWCIALAFQKSNSPTDVISTTPMGGAVKHKNKWEEQVKGKNRIGSERECSASTERVERIPNQESVKKAQSTADSRVSTSEHFLQYQEAINNSWCPKSPVSNPYSSKDQVTSLAVARINSPYISKDQQSLQ